MRFHLVLAFVSICVSCLPRPASAGDGPLAAEDPFVVLDANLTATSGSGLPEFDRVLVDDIL